MCRIVITGPESVGKSTMAAFLASAFDGVEVPEYAREYVETHGLDYSEEDVVAIANHQIEEDLRLQGKNSLVFYDSWLFVTKVWFEEVYHHCPEFVLDHINDHSADLFILLKCDLPWIDDPTRENGGERREYLYERYRQELERNHCNYVEVSGIGESRFVNAKRVVAEFLSRRDDNLKVRENE